MLAFGQPTGLSQDRVGRLLQGKRRVDQSVGQLDQDVVDRQLPAMLLQNPLVLRDVHVEPVAGGCGRGRRGRRLDALADRRHRIGSDLLVLVHTQGLCFLSWHVSLTFVMAESHDSYGVGRRRCS